MPTLSLRVDDDTKAKIEAAAKEAGYATYAGYLRGAIQTALHREDIRTTGEDNVVQTSDAVLQENTRLKREIELKDELIAGKEAHIADLQVQVGLLTRLALPPPKKERKHWWERLYK
jgi:predicted transcriptional regulator